MNKRIFVSGLAALCFAPAIVWAGGGSGVIKWIGTQECCGAPGPYFFIKMAVRESPPTCVDSNQLFAARIDQSRGKAMYALVLAAYAQGKSVSVDGKGTCAEVRPVFEDIDGIYIVDQ